MAIDCRERDRALVRSLQALPYYRVHLTGNASRCPARPLAIRDGREYADECRNAVAEVFKLFNADSP